MAGLGHWTAVQTGGQSLSVLLQHGGIPSQGQGTAPSTPAEYQDDVMPWIFLEAGPLVRGGYSSETHYIFLHLVISCVITWKVFKIMRIKIVFMLKSQLMNKSHFMKDDIVSLFFNLC